MPWKETSPIDQRIRSIAAVAEAAGLISGEPVLPWMWRRKEERTTFARSDRRPDDEKKERHLPDASESDSRTANRVAARRAAAHPVGRRGGSESVEPALLRIRPYPS